MIQTASEKVLYAAELEPLIQPLEEIMTSASFDAVPSLLVMLDSKPEPYHYRKRFEEARHDPIAVLHSSGSTGILESHMDKYEAHHANKSKAYQSRSQLPTGL